MPNLKTITQSAQYAKVRIYEVYPFYTCSISATMSSYMEISGIYRHFAYQPVSIITLGNYILAIFYYRIIHIELALRCKV